MSRACIRRQWLMTSRRPMLGISFTPPGTQPSAASSAVVTGCSWRGASAGCRCATPAPTPSHTSLTASISKASCKRSRPHLAAASSQRAVSPPCTRGAAGLQPRCRGCAFGMRRPPACSTMQPSGGRKRRGSAAVAASPSGASGRWRTCCCERASAGVAGRRLPVATSAHFGPLSETLIYPRPPCERLGRAGGHTERWRIRTDFSRVHC
mmetsp:Transcript_41459/g.119489  ORF Transcript_41459/g.119489 Transcript_41459/m.119489 type:complete len:209 (-) Transcript_41459:33-659(-)